MAGSKPATRLYVGPALAPGQTVGLDHGQAHSLRSVLRPGPGARLPVFNARDGEWLAEIDAPGTGRSLQATLEHGTATAPETDLVLAFAQIKGAPVNFPT